MVKLMHHRCQMDQICLMVVLTVVMFLRQMIQVMK